MIRKSKGHSNIDCANYLCLYLLLLISTICIPKSLENNNRILMRFVVVMKIELCFWCYYVYGRANDIYPLE